MRALKLSLGIFAVLFLVSLVLYLGMKTDQSNRLKFGEKTNLTKIEFIRNHVPLYTTTFSDLSTENSLLESASTLPFYHHFPLKEVQSLEAFSKTCQSFPSTNTKALHKTIVWYSYLCGKSKSLPQDFFNSPPFMHYSGKSFALLAYLSDRPEFKVNNWALNQKALFHVLELKNFPQIENTKYLEYGIFEQIKRNESVFLGDKYIAFSIGRKEKEVTNKLDFFDKALWDNYTENSGLLATKFKEGDYCFHLDGNLCWNISPAYRNAEKIFLSTVFVSAFFFLICCLLLLLDRSKTIKRQQDSRKFLLQTLTHELRTPITTLQLVVEGFRKGFDKLDADAQVHFLRLADEVQRLHRLVRMSANYLSADSNDLKIKMEVHPSANDCVQKLVDSEKDNITLNLLPVDTTLNCDLQWLEICLRNLIENAKKHGKKPVILSLSNESEVVHITVEDSGVLHSTINPKTDGMGVGLKIVKRAVEKMNGKFTFDKDPTRFRISIKGVRA